MLCFWKQNGIDDEKWSWIDAFDLLSLLGSLCLAEKTSPHICVWKKTMLLVGSKIWRSRWISSREKKIWKTHPGNLLCDKLFQKNEFLPSVMAELGWAGSLGFVIFLIPRIGAGKCVVVIGCFSLWLIGHCIRTLPFIPSEVSEIVFVPEFLWAQFLAHHSIVDLFRYEFLSLGTDSCARSIPGTVVRSNS